MYRGAVRRVLVATAVAIACGTWASSALAAPAPLGLVANNQSPFDTVSTFDPAAETTGQPIGVSGDNTWVGVSPDGTKAYTVVVYPTPAFEVLDPGTRSAAGSAQLPNGNFFWGAVSPDGTRAYVSGGGELLPIDLTTDPPTVGSAISVTNATGVAFSPDGKTAWVVGGGTSAPTGVIPVNVATGSLGTEIPTGAGAYGVAVSPDGNAVWVANHDAQTVSEINPDTKTVIRTVTIGAGHPLYLSVSPDGSRVWVSLQNEHEVTWINTADGSVGTAVNTGGVEARGVAVTPDGKTVFVTDGTLNGSGQGSQVTPVDVTTTPPTAKTAMTGYDDPVWDAITSDQAPVANFTVQPQSAGSATSFDASSSAPGSSPIATYAWNFGDGTTQTTTQPTVSHTYQHNATYQASVTETDTAGTSTTQIYTGQQVIRNGNALASATKSVIISTVAQPAVKLSTASVDFGTRAPGMTGAMDTVTVTNTGGSDLAMGTVSVVGRNASDFLLSANSCADATIAPGRTCAVNVTFRPSANGARTALLQFADNATGSPQSVFLNGTGDDRGTLTGTVYNGAATSAPPVNGANVSVCTFSSRAICRSATTNARGAFTVSGLPAGAYQVEVLPTGNSLFPGSQVVTVGAGTTVSQDFHLQAPHGLPSGFVFNGSNGSAPTTSFWTSPSDLQVPLQLANPVPRGSFAGTVVTFFAAPDTPGAGRASLGSLTIVYYVDSSGVPRFVEDILGNFYAGYTQASAGTLGQWRLQLRDAPTVGSTNMTGAIVDGVLTPPAHGPYFHGGATYEVAQNSFLFAPAAGGSADRGARVAGNGLPPTPGSPGGPSRTYGPPGSYCSVPSQSSSPGPQKVYTDHKVETPFKNGGRVDRSDPKQPWYIDPKGNQFPQDPNWAYQDPKAAPGSKPDSIFANPDGSGFRVENPSGKTIPVQLPNPGDPNSPIVQVHPGDSTVPTVTADGSPSNGYGMPSSEPSSTNTAPAPVTDMSPGSEVEVNPWQDAPGARSLDIAVHPPRARTPVAHAACGPPTQPPEPAGGGDDWNGYVDPSGAVVTTHGVPVAGAKVILLRSATRKGKLKRVPKGSRVMSPANRRNPDHTNADGHFGWDVWPGFYRVQAAHGGCSTASTKLLVVPPPVSTLRLVLNCPHLRRTATRTGVRLKSIPVAQTMLIATVRTSRGHALRGGVVIFSVGGRRVGEAPLTRRNGVVAISVRRVARNARVVATYVGNGVYAPSYGSTRQR